MLLVREFRPDRFVINRPEKTPWKQILLRTGKQYCRGHYRTCEATPADFVHTDDWRGLKSRPIHRLH